jgi:hypothetical protein
VLITECSHILLAVDAHLAEEQTVWVEWILNLKKAKVNNFQDWKMTLEAN